MSWNFVATMHDHVLKLIYNLCPSLHDRNHMGSLIYKPFLCNILCLFTLDECKHLTIFPICLAMLSTHVATQSSFWINLSFSNKIKLNYLHRSQTNSDVFGAYRCRVEGWVWRAEECRDWKSIRRCNMQEGGMAEKAKGVVHVREEGLT
jgi:hypothetical protein